MKKRRRRKVKIEHMIISVKHQILLTFRRTTIESRDQEGEGYVKDLSAKAKQRPRHDEHHEEPVPDAPLTHIVRSECYDLPRWVL